MTTYSKDDIREWLCSLTKWPNAESYDIESLSPCGVLERRERALKQMVPAWFWQGERGAAVLSIGTGKAYFERKYWGAFTKVYSVDPSETTRLALQYYPIPNLQFLGSSMFGVPVSLSPAPTHAWLGACIHYLFEEFHGWEFMHKLGMMVSDTIIVDAGVFDADRPQGQKLLSRWDRNGVYQRYRAAEFSFSSFLKRIEGIWRVTDESATSWIDDGRRSLVLKRLLPPIIQRRDLGDLEEIVKRLNWAVYRTKEGYYKECPHITPLLVHDTVSKVMGWTDFVRWRVHDGNRLCGFVTTDCGSDSPINASIAERLHLSLMSWLLPLGLLPADLAKQNIRIKDGEPIWIDIDLVGLREMDTARALWVTTNLYKEYSDIPVYVKGVNRESGSTPNRLLTPAAPVRFVERFREAVESVTPNGAITAVVSKGDDELIKFGARVGWHFPQNEDGEYSGYYPADSIEAIEQLEALRSMGAGYFVVPAPASWWLTHYTEFSAHLHRSLELIFSKDDLCSVYAFNSDGMRYRSIDPSSAKSTVPLESKGQPISFVCNICGHLNDAGEGDFARETASCATCRSTVRGRAIIHTLSRELFGKDLVLTEFPSSKHIRGIGMSDWSGYAGPLSQKLAYENTFYHMEPKVDITNLPPGMERTMDFVISSDVFEHVMPPVSVAFRNLHKLLKPGGVVVFTAPYRTTGSTVEHYPSLYDFKIEDHAGRHRVLNTRIDGVTEVFDDPVFHGGPGATLEMRLFSEQSLIDEFASAGFTQIKVHKEQCQEHGIYWESECSLPISARAK